MITVKPKQQVITRMKSHNTKLALAAALATFVGAVSFNLDVPANWLLSAGRTDLALPCYQTMTSFALDLHINNARTADALAHLADCYAAAESYDEALKVQQQAIAMYRETLGEDSVPVFIGMARVGQYLNAKGNYVRAELILQEAVQGLERATVPDTEATALVYANLADTLSAQEKNYPAIAVLEKLMPIDEKLMRLKQRSVDSYDRLGAIYARLGRENLSKQTIEAGIKLKERILGVEKARQASHSLKSS